MGLLSGQKEGIIKGFKVVTTANVLAPSSK
jgi:hypothetical protein